MKNTIKLLAVGGLVLGVLGANVQAGLGLNWATPSGLVQADGSTPLLESGSALFQLIWSMDAVADPPTVGGGVSGDDILFDQQVAGAATAGTYAQHFADTYENLAWSTPGYLFVRVYDRGTSVSNVPNGMAYFDGALVAVEIAWTFPTTYQEIPEGTFAGGSSLDGKGRYVLDQQVGGPLPEPPALDVTNANETVAHSVSNRIIGGTSSNLTGQIRWTNSLNGANGSIDAAAAWSFTSALAVGTNVITASGTNSAGASASDAVAIVRQSAANPAIDLVKSVSADGTPAGAVKFLQGTNQQPVTYFFVISNVGEAALTNVVVDDPDVAYNALIGDLAVGQSVTTSVADVIGASLVNVATVSAYGPEGQPVSANDSAEVEMEVPSPYIEITNSILAVAHSVSNLTVMGASANLAGHIRWTNGLTGSSSQIAVAEEWSFVCSLAVGTNPVTVVGTNDFGQSAAHTVYFVRSAAPAATPYLDVTNANETVANGVSNRAVGGTSSNLVGLIRWTNSLNGLTGTLAADPVWTFACPLAVGSNPITVWGTNSAGQVASDTVTILRADPQGGVIIFQPGPGLNDGSDDGRAGAGKDANGGNCNGSGSNEGDAVYLYADPISDCNPCHSKMFIQFNLDTLPVDVAAVYVGFTHIPQTDYCLSNCEADFNFYPLTGAWNEMTVNLDNQPARGALVLGPVRLAFPNDPGTREYEITGLYREWKNGTIPNHGLEISSDDVGCNNAAVAFYVHSSDAADPAQRPYLRVLTGASPYLAITNVPDTVANSVSNYTLGGIANTQVVGQITWSNSLGGAGSLPASTNWEVTVPLAVGDNLITVSGTNQLGETASDAITIVRADIGLPGIELVKTAFPETYSAAGETIGYMFTVRNIGAVTLTNVMVSDPLVAVSGGPIELAPGAEDSTTFTATYLITPADLDAGQVYNTATATGEDPGGVNVEDDDAATVCRNLFMTPPPDVTLDCTEDVSTNNTGVATAASGCGCFINLTHADIMDPGNCPQSYILRRIWRAEDNCANLIIHTQVITVVDTEAPDLTLPADETVACDAVPAVGAAIATDNCDADVTVFFNGEVRTDGACPGTYTLTRTWTATDDCGNATSLSQTIEVQDAVAPDLTIPADETVECDAVPAAGTATATDICDADVTVFFNGEVRADGACANRYTLTRTWTAIDDCGNSTTLSQTIEVQDTAAPDLIVPVDVTVECAPPPPPAVTATDSCDLDVPVSLSVTTNGQCPAMVVRVWTATDDCGNSVSATQRVTVVDTMPPVLPTLPGGGDLGINPIPPGCTEGLMAADDCDGAMPAVCVAGGITGAGNNKSQTFTYTAADACGNAATGTVTCTWLVVLLAPTNPAAAATSMSRIQLTWTDNNYYETGYALERRNSSNAVWIALVTLPANTGAYEDMGLAAGQTYTYRLFAVNPDGSSPPSIEISATTPGVPAPPANFTAAARATNQIGLTWTDQANNETGFEVQRRAGAAGAWGVAAVLPAEAASYTDSGLAPNSLYYYRLRATNAVGASAFSGEASASTWPLPEDPDCAYELAVTATNLTADGGGMVWPAQIPENAVVGGTLGIRQTSPRSLGTVQRVAVGFRNLAGQAVGRPREMALLQGVPGCPGRNLAAVSMPADVRAPVTAGSYHLWIEAYVSPADPVATFQAQVRTNTGSLVKNLGLLTVQPRPASQIQVRILPSSGLIGQTLVVPVLVNSTGGVSSVGFTVVYDPAIVANPRVRPGADAPAVWPVVNTATVGRVGALLLLPDKESLPGGTRQLAEIWFDSVASGVSALTFADVPVAREVAFVDPEISQTVEWMGDSATVLMPGFEADIVSRPGGDLSVTEADVLMMQLLVAGIEPPAGSNEYRKADCSPRASSGNGRLDVADLRQAIRYQNGVDALQPEGGPWAPTNGVLSRKPGAGLLSESDRTLAVADQTVTRGETFWLAVELAAQGNESTLGFSLEFDPALLTYLDVRKVGAAGDATLVPSLNDLANGRVGFALAMPGVAVWPAGTAPMLEVAFATAAGNSLAVAPIVFGDSPVIRSCADIHAGTLTVAYTGGAVTLQPVVASGAPDTPVGLTAEATATNQIHLAWTDAANDETGFRVLRRSGVQPWNSIAVLAPDVENYSDVGLAAGQAYRYQVEVFNGSGSGFSDEVEATTWNRLTAWRLAKFGTAIDEGAAGDAGDWDEDGVPNQLEYGLGTDPADDQDPVEAWAMALRDGVQIGSDRFLTAIYRLGPDAASDMQIQMQLSTDLLLPWTISMVPVDETLLDGVRQIRVRSDQPLGVRWREFMRMRALPATD